MACTFCFPSVSVGVKILFTNPSFLFLKKWSKREKDFSECFENESLKTHDSWYERYSTCTLSRNNSLEATNKIIKDEHTFRERHTLSRFFTIVNDIVNKKMVQPSQSESNRSNCIFYRTNNYT